MNVPIHSDPWTQSEFLSIAGAIKDKIESSDLATWLRVPLDIVDENDTKRNQIVKILTYWQSMNGSTHSKTKLLENLRNLDIEEALKPYLGL